MTPASRSRAWWLTAAAAVLVGLAGTWVSVGGARLATGLPDLAVGWMMAGAGLVAWAAMPRSRVGPLLALAGIATFIEDGRSCLDLTPLVARCLDVPGLASAAGALELAWAGLLGIALLTFPTGRSTGHRHATAAALAAFAWAGMSLLPGAWSGEGGTLAFTAVLTVLVGTVWWLDGPLGRAARRPVLWVAAGILAAVTGAELVDRVVDVLVAGAWTTSPIAGLRTITAAAMLPVAGAIGAGVVAGVLVERADAPGRALDRVVELGEREPAARAGEETGGAAGRPERADMPDDGDADPTLGFVMEELEADRRLREQAEARLREVEASRQRLLDAAIDERRELERRLQSGPGHQLEQLADAIAALIAVRPPPDRTVVAHASRVSEQLAITRQEIRELALGLHPRVLDEQSLQAALGMIAERVPVPVDLRVSLPKEPPQALRIACWFLVGEALANVVKHAGATHARVAVEDDRGALRITVEDDGVGGAVMGRAGGLAGMRQRVEALDGTLTLDSPAGTGTRLVVVLPTDEARGRVPG